MFAIGWDSPRLTSRESGPGLPSLRLLKLEVESLGKDMPAFSLRGFLTSAIIVLTLESTYYISGWPCIASCPYPRYII
jgi:hypothetical protein